MSETVDPYIEGYWDYNNGKYRSDNLYESGTPEHLEWYYGWRDAAHWNDDYEQ